MTQIDENSMNTRAKDATTESGDKGSSAGARARWASLTGSLNFRSSAIMIVLLVLAVYFQFAADGLFLTPRNVTLLARQASLLSVLAAGITVIMVMREIDLSTGSAVFITSIAIAELLTATTPVNPWVAVVAGVAVGFAIGAWNAFWVVVMRVPSFIATLAGLLALRGLGLMWTDAQTIGPFPDEFVNFTESFIGRQASLLIVVVALLVCLALLFLSWRNAMRDGEKGATSRLVLRCLMAVVVAIGAVWAIQGFLGIPTAVVWVTLIATALWWLLTRTSFGHNAYLIGANREAAVYAGVSVRRHLAIAFLLMGLLYGIGGMMLSSRLGVLTPGSGVNLELDVIAAAVIGGVSLRGGVGTIPGAISGAVLLTVINNGFSLMNVSSFLQDVVKGLILLVALSVDAYIRGRRAGQ